MDTWETLRDKGVASLKNDDAEEAVQHLSDAISLSAANHELLFSRGTAYVKLEKWADAVADLEKAVELKPAFEKGHARLAVAQFGSKDFIGARRSYQNALNLSPGNEEYQKAMVACKDATDKAASDNAAEKAIPELVQKLNDPRQIAKLKEHKTTGDYFKDPEFLEMLDTIRANPTTVQKYLQEPRMLQCIGVILDMPLVDTVANTQLKREQFTISSDEESESEEESEDEAEDDGGQTLPAPLSRSKPPPKPDTAGQPAVYQDGLLKGLPINGGKPGGDGAAPGVHRLNADSSTEELRKGVAAKLGMTVEQMDRMSRFAHTGSFEAKTADGGGADKGLTAEMASVAPVAQPGADVDTSAPAPDPVPPTPQPEVEDDPAEVFLPDDIPDSKEGKVAVATATKAKATTFYQARKFRCALKLYEFAHSLDSSNMVYMLNMAAVHLEMKKFEDCLKCVDEAIDLGNAAMAEASPGEGPTELLGKAHHRRGLALDGLNLFGDSVKAYKKALEFNRCEKYLKARNKALKAHENFMTEKEYDPLKAQGCKARGNDFYQKKEYPQAIAEYEKAIKHDPKNTDLLAKVYSNRAACFTQMGEMALAVKSADMCIAADPNFVKGYIRKGEVMLLTEQWLDAEKVFRKSVEVKDTYQGREGLKKALKGKELLSKTAATRAEQAMQNKEIREIWESVRWLLKEMTENPESRKVQKELEDPVVRAKLAKLRAAGLM